MRFFVSFLLFSAFAFAELREVEVTWKADGLFDTSDGVIFQVSCNSPHDMERIQWKRYDTYEMTGYKGKVYYDTEDKQLIFSDVTCNVVKVFNNKQN